MRIAVAGAGQIGQRHADLLAQGGAARLAAVVDPAAATAGLAARHGVPWHRDLDTLLAAGGVDGVILATPTPLHLPQALQCIAAGVPVLVEKPVAATEAEALVMARAAEAAGVPVLVGHHRRHNPRIAAAHDWLRSGAIGAVVSVTGMVLMCKPDDYFLPAWRRAPGAGPMLTNLIHDIDTLRHLVGEVVAMQAVASNARRGFEIEDTAAVLLHFANGALGTVTLSDTAAAPWSWELTAAENPAYPATGQSCTLIAGTEASIDLPGLRVWRHRGARGWHQPIDVQTLPVTDADPLIRQIAHFADVIAGAPPLVAVRDAARSVGVVDAIRRAAHSGQTEHLTEG